MILDSWSIVGFIGNGLYTSRVLVQWFSSEKAKKCPKKRTRYEESYGSWMIRIYRIKTRSRN